jgi:hypothetical protein
MIEQKCIPDALFTVGNIHKCKVFIADQVVKCDTCSLSNTMALALLFAAKNGVLKMTIDGCSANRGW